MKLLTIVAAVALLAACTQQTTNPKEQVIARVNGEPIYMHDFLLSYRQLKGEQDEISQKDLKSLEALKNRALNEAIIVRLLQQTAAKKQLRIAREEVDGRLANWKDSYPPGAFEEMLRKQNTTEDFLRHRIEDQLLIEKITENLFASETMVSDEEIRKHFQLHENEFIRPEKVHAFQIVVPTKQEADKIRQEILSGSLTFESAARKYSLSPDAAKGGDLGFFARNEKISAFNEAFSLSINAVSKPVQSRYGVHLLKIVEKQPSRKLNFQEAKNDVVRALKRLKEVKVYKEWITKLLKDGEIYRNEALFNSTT